MKPGIYLHYKGKSYLVTGKARHSETGELMVIYLPLYGCERDVGEQQDFTRLCVRPLSMFKERVDPATGMKVEDTAHGVERFRLVTPWEGT